MRYRLLILAASLLGLGTQAQAQSSPYAEVLAQGRSELCPRAKTVAAGPAIAWNKLTPAQARAAITLHLAQEGAHCGWGKAVVYSEADPEFGIYRPAHKLRHIGALFDRRGAKWFVSQVVPGMAAAEAGLKRGDEIVSANGSPFDPVASLAGKTVTLKWRRDPWGKTARKTLPITTASAARFFDEMGDRSWTLFERGGKRIASLAIPRVPSSFATLRERLKVAQSVADVLILDLRGGVAEETPGLLPLFLETESGQEKPLFSKPMIVLVNGKTAGTREWLASFLQEQNRSVLIGTATAGAFAPRVEKAFGDDKWLVRVPRLDKAPPPAEGTGLQPDLTVADELVYAGGRDEVWERAVSAAVELGQGSKDTSG